MSIQCCSTLPPFQEPPLPTRAFKDAPPTSPPLPCQGCWGDPLVPSVTWCSASSVPAAVTARKDIVAEWRGNCCRSFTHLPDYVTKPLRGPWKGMLSSKFHPAFWFCYRATPDESVEQRHQFGLTLHCVHWTNKWENNFQLSSLMLGRDSFSGSVQYLILKRAMARFTCWRELKHEEVEGQNQDNAKLDIWSQNLCWWFPIYILKLVELKKLTPKSAKSCRNKKADSKNC